MDISATNAPAKANAAATTSSGTQIASDFETFLRMMTAQLKNQDPLNPIDSADYAVQLATFSGVEQQAKTNQLLEAIGSQFGMMGMAQMAGWVGKEARAAAPVWVTDAPVALSPNPAAGADRAVLVVKDADGTVVNRVDIAVSSDALDWQPVDIEGDPLAEGKYSFEMESYLNGEITTTTPVEAYANIIEVRGGANGSTVVLEGGIEVSIALVTALRE
ncbi:MAG: flagellar hook capping FlgD N-terminal domain-containing protein [Paracoccaceae bacterium]